MPNNPYPKLKKDYDHLLGRTWDLFCYGRDREGKLETAVANAWKTCERLENEDDIKKIKSTLKKLEIFCLKTLENNQKSNKEVDSE